MDWFLKDGSIADSKSDHSQVDLSKEIQNGPNQNGFDYYFGMSASANHSPHCFIEDGYTVGELEVLDDKQTKAAAIDGKPGLVAKGFKQSEILPRFTEKTCEWIKSQVNKNPEQPFFVYMPLNSPHSPIVPSEGFLPALYKVLKCPLFGDIGDQLFLSLRLAVFENEDETLAQIILASVISIVREESKNKEA